MKEWKVFWFSWIIWWRGIFELVPKKETHLLLFYDLQMAREERWKRKKFKYSGLNQHTPTLTETKAAAVWDVHRILPSCWLPSVLKTQMLLPEEACSPPGDSIYALHWNLHPYYDLLQPIYSHVNK